MTFCIFSDIAAPVATLKLLREGTSGHQLLLSNAPSTSVLQKAPPDPQLVLADIAFGQPDPEAVAQASRLKWIQISSSSITRYDYPGFRTMMTERHIAVCNSARVYREACAEHALAFMLAQSRLLPESLSLRVPSGTDAWHHLRGNSIPLQGQSALIVGYGAIGHRLVELLRPFDIHITALRRNKRGDELVPVIAPDQLHQALAQGVDHVINILPDSEETRNFFDSERFASMKPGTVFYNIGRGTTVDQLALLSALQSGRLKAAWLDVTDPEPLPENHPLLKEPNCFITPHVAGGHRDESMTLVRHFLANLARFVRNEPLLDRVM